MYKLIYQLLPDLYTNGTVCVIKLSEAHFEALRALSENDWENAEAREKAKKRAITTVMTLTTNSLLK